MNILLGVIIAVEFVLIGCVIAADNAPKTFTCTVVIQDGTPGRLRSTTYEGTGYMNGDALICKIK